MFFPLTSVSSLFPAHRPPLTAFPLPPKRRPNNSSSPDLHISPVSVPLSSPLLAYFHDLIPFPFSSFSSQLSPLVDSLPWPKPYHPTYVVSLCFLPLLLFHNWLQFPFQFLLFPTLTLSLTQFPSSYKSYHPTYLLSLFFHHFLYFHILPQFPFLFITHTYT